MANAAMNNAEQPHRRRRVFEVLQCRFFKEVTKQMKEQEEQFVDADTLAHFLGETRRYVLYLARTGAIRSYPLAGRIRIIRKFRISEVTSDLVGRHRKIRRKRDNGSNNCPKKAGIKIKK